MENPWDHKRLVLLRCLDEMSEENEVELLKLESLYHLNDEEEMALNYALEREGYLGAVYEGFDPLPDGSTSSGTVTFRINEKGKRALKYFTIPSESKEREEYQENKRIETKRYKSQRAINIWALIAPVATSIVGYVVGENQTNIKLNNVQKQLDSITNVVSNLPSIPGGGVIASEIIHPNDIDKAVADTNSIINKD